MESESPPLATAWPDPLISAHIRKPVRRPGRGERLNLSLSLSRGPCYLGGHMQISVAASGNFRSCLGVPGDRWPFGQLAMLRCLPEDARWPMPDFRLSN
ncbi:hypothetical protein ACLKA6_010957 [Drosophila palustris]